VVDGELSGVNAATKAEAFRRLALEHLDKSYRLARAITGDRAEAEDATHDAFVQAWRRWGSLRDPARFDAWFGRILVNTCRDRLRRAKRRQSSDLSPELAVSADAYRQAEDRDQIASALAHLSVEHRVVVALRYYRDLSTRQIAEQLGLAEGTVSSRLHHALRQMRAELDRVPVEGATHA
jgi:RNA polymerase sigma-70 factor (ECF subfamily)